MKLYHVVACLESRFESIDEALKVYNTNTPIIPRVPSSRMPSEDGTTERICVSTNIYNCIKAIGIFGVFRRCLAANEDAKSYEVSKKEIYPILIVEFNVEEKDVMKPTIDQVVDCEVNNELWILEPTIPSKVEVKWLHSRSIIMNDNFDEILDIKFVELNDFIHPYLTGTGNELDSSNEEYIEGDLPYYMCKNISKILSPYCVNLVCENYHSEVCFVSVSNNNNSIAETELLNISKDEYGNLEVTHWFPSIKEETRDEAFYILCEYASKFDNIHVVDSTKQI